MYAIVDIAGQQFKVEKDQKLFVHRLEGEEGNKVSFDKVLLLDTGSKIAVGNPVVKGASVTVKILSHVKGDKVLVFKKKRRKGYKKLNGHRQYMTQVQIETISEKAAAKSEAASEKPKAESTPKKAAPAKPKAESTAKKATPAKPKAESAAKKATPAKPKAESAAKKAAPKKAAPKKTAPKKEEGEGDK